MQSQNLCTHDQIIHHWLNLNIIIFQKSEFSSLPEVLFSRNNKSGGAARSTQGHGSQNSVTADNP